MTTFQQATRDHSAVRSAAQVDSQRAKHLWLGVRGHDRHLPFGSFAETVANVMPTEHLMLLRTSAVAAAWAFDGFWSLSAGDEHRTPFERREAARAAWQLFTERAERAKQLAEGFGCDMSAAWEHERRIGSSKINTDEVVAIAKLAGRMYTALKARKATQVSTAPEEVHSVELGGNVGRLLPSELAHLDSPTEALLLARIADKRALQYAMRGQNDASRGPLVIALDESGSMHDNGNEQRNVWAKASAIALARTALDDRRPVTVVHYGTSCVPRRIEPGCCKPLMAMVAHFLGGGTDIPQALTRSAQVVDELARAGDKGADVVLVSDGTDNKMRGSAGVAAVDAIEKTGSRLWTVAIQCDLSGVLRDRAEKYVHMSGRDMRDERSVGKLAEVVL